MNNQIKPAVLTIDISYKKDNIMVCVKKDTRILVDTNENVALIENDHVDIFAEEYTILH